ncbi:hypothetical protein D1136_00930 [Odoribacter sp. Z80]|nr:hypothetical protein [Odoribacter sp. Z80]
MNCMKEHSYLSHHYLYFSRWTRKGYSIFAGLGREVRIARLTVGMYRKVLLKSASHGVVINTDKISEAEMQIRQNDLFQKMAVNLKGEVCPDKMLCI